jgi:hypothetical protein
LVACTDRDLSALAGELAEIRALAGAGVVAVTAETEARGVIAASQFASTAAWVADAAWHSRRESATIAKAAALFARDEYAPVADAVCDGDMDLASAVACGQEFAKLAPDLTESAKPLVLEHLLDMAYDHGPAGVRRLKDEILARYGENGEFEEQCERRRRHIELSAGRLTEGGMWDYRLTVDGEGRAVLEAAIGPGSAPKPAGISGCGDVPPGPDAGLCVTTRDTRPVGRRRGEALIDALRRSVTASRHVPTSPKAILMLTMDYADLTAKIGTASAKSEHASTGHASIGTARIGSRGSGGAGAVRDTQMPAGFSFPAGGRTRAGVVLGSRAAGELISPCAVRRIACDAGIIPVVLGGRGEVLDQGVMERCFTTGQVRALWKRDRHCTFPGCDIPAAWCDAHHLVHWIDGGVTNLDNGALLCSRHHSIVHRDQLAGRVAHTCGDPPGGTRRARRGFPQGESPEQRAVAAPEGSPWHGPGTAPESPPRRSPDASPEGPTRRSFDASPGAQARQRPETAFGSPPRNRSGAAPEPHLTSVVWDLRPGAYVAVARGSEDRLTA